MSWKDTLRRRVPLPAILAWRRFKYRELVATRAGERCFADQPLDLRRILLFRRESFPDSGPTPWLDRPDALERIAERRAAGEITAEEAELCRRWQHDGLLLLEGFHEPQRVDAIWAAVGEAVSSGRLPVALESMVEGGPYEGRFQNLHREVPELAEILRHPPTLELVRLLLGRDVHPFQTIAFFAGSQQPAHSDLVHMTTYPLGYLAGAWTAMEDIHADSGPLLYYPGSHRLPFCSARDAGITARESVVDFYAAYHAKYEPFIERLLEAEGCEPVEHTPRKGDLLLWHANLLHGGAPRREPRRSRKSVVCHYLASDAICYHDVSASLADLS